MGQLFKIENYLLNISRSVGIALHLQDSGDRNLLVKHADLTLYYAKSTGRNNVKLYTDIQIDQELLRYD
jgi:GGDEF domain-containing protein